MKEKLKALYIGHYKSGSTSQMRGDYLQELLPDYHFLIVNTDVPIDATPKIVRSVGWRYKTGPLITNINRYITSTIKNDFTYDLVWVDKGVFINPGIIESLRRNSGKLVHFTPDTAFTYNRSTRFFEALSNYDYCITTKSFEIESYKKYGVKTIFCTQGYDHKVHRPYYHFGAKQGVVFIGHREAEREYIISELVDRNIKVTLAGSRWEKFAAKRKQKSNLIYKGTGIFGQDYARELSAALLGLGLLSKRFPELHTTRTFEIPACGTALVTEHNPEIGSIFADDEVVYYDDPDDAVAKIEYYLSKREKLLPYAENGYRKVSQGRYSYYDILGKVLKQINE